MSGKMLAIIGAQYGSEGKGVITSSLANEYSVHVRVGSPNAGHSFCWNNEIHTMQCIPCGWINHEAKIVIGRGALINIEYLLSEIKHIEKFDPDFKRRLFIDAKAGILSENFKQEEGGLSGEYNARIGSTGEGVGVARIARIKRDKNYFHFFEDVANLYNLSCCVAFNTPELLATLQDNGEDILLEGTQGSALSLLHGDWPYVTSVDTNAAALLSEIGIAPSRITNILLVARTFPIRVGGNSGPLNNEIDWEILSSAIGRKVIEKTTVTKRVRRVGRWDDKLLYDAILLNKPTSIALTFLDYIDPTSEGISDYESLSIFAKDYVEELEQKFKTPISIIGTGGKNFSTIRRYEAL